MARHRKVGKNLRVYSRWYDEGNFDMNMFNNRQELLDYYEGIEERYRHHMATTFLIDYIKRNKFKNVVSFGAGVCAMEYKILKSCPGVTMTATEYQKRLMDKINPYFKDMDCICFDFFKDNIVDLVDSVGHGFDFGFACASTYAMDSKTFVDFFKGLNHAGIYNVVDMSGGIVSHKRFFGKYLYRMCNSGSYLLNGKLRFDEDFLPEGRPFGYGKTVDELRRLYGRAGYDIVGEPVIDGFDYTTLLKKS